MLHQEARAADELVGLLRQHPLRRLAAVLGVGRLVVFGLFLDDEALLQDDVKARLDVFVIGLLVVVIIAFFRRRGSGGWRALGTLDDDDGGDGVVGVIVGQGIVIIIVVGQGIVLEVVVLEIIDFEVLEGLVAVLELSLIHI